MSPKALSIMALTIIFALFFTFLRTNLTTATIASVAYILYYLSLIKNMHFRTVFQTISASIFWLVGFAVAAQIVNLSVGFVAAILISVITLDL